MGVMPLAIVAESGHKRVFIPFDEAHEQVALIDSARYLNDIGLNNRVPVEPARGTFASNAQGRRYGFKTFSDYFTTRQLIAIATLSDLIEEALKRVESDAIAIQTVGPDSVSLAGAYAAVVLTYLAFAVDKVINWLTTLSHWWPGEDKIRPTFTRQALSMTWDFSESGPFGNAAGDLGVAIHGLARAIENLPCSPAGIATT